MTEEKIRRISELEMCIRDRAVAYLLHGIRHIRQCVGHRVQPPAHPYQCCAAALPEGPCPCLLYTSLPTFGPLKAQFSTPLST